MRYTALTIAGFDSSGGAGLQADLKVFSVFNCYGMSVLTALPIQNTQGVQKCYEIPLSAIEEQLEAIFTDITPHAIKIGMLFNESVINIVSKYLKKYAQDIPIIVDPVMVAKSGDNLLLPNSIESLKQEILPLATLVTPNIPEAKVILAQANDVSLSQLDMAKALIKLGIKNVLLKGGHLHNSLSTDILYLEHNQYFLLEKERINSKNTHGTGCTLSAAITAEIAKGKTLYQACCHAKNYLHQALIWGDKYKLGQGNGPLYHEYQAEIKIKN